MKVPTGIHSRILAAAIALPALAQPAARAASMSAAPTPPAVDGEDIARLGTPTDTDKWWPDSATDFGNPGMTIGQTFETGSGAVLLKAVTFKIKNATVATKTYTLRVGTVSGTTFTEVHSEPATQDFATAADDYWTWTLDSPLLLSAGTLYAVDLGLNSSTSSWSTGIPYVHYAGDTYPDGSRFRSGTAGNGVGDDTLSQLSGDRIFHLDLERPITAGFEFVAGSPEDDAVNVLVPAELVATFSRDLAPGTGTLTIRNLTDSLDTVIPVADDRVSLVDNLLVITPDDPLLWNRHYAIRIDPGAIRSTSGDSFAGISDDTTWNFSTAGGDPLLDAIAELKDHVLGTITLDAAAIAAHKATIDTDKRRLGESAATIGAALDLVATYDSVIGPLWVARGQFDRDNQPDDLDWTIYHVMQHVVDEVYTSDTLAAHRDLLDGYKFGSSANFPGPLDPPADPQQSHTVPVNGSFPDSFGRDTQQWTLPARKPTGCYLAPGTIATVTVPPSLVDRGYQVRVGAHSWDLSHRRWVRRLDRSTILYDLDRPTIKVASPLGGGIYIEVPMLADAGVADVTVTGAVRAPYFSAKSFHTTSLAEWRDTERHHPAPWADFQSDKFMMQVPTSWIYALDDPATLMADWDAAMDAMNDLMGFPHLRGKETMYPQVDVLFRSSVHAPGYPSVNVTDNPNNDRGGYHNHHLVRGPRSASDYEFHEQGHAYFFPKFGGETESAVNLHHVAVQHRKFRVGLDQAFAGSRGFAGNPHRTLDNTAVTWMTVFNFSPREVPMATGEKAYQLKGHAKFVDIARLFGWEGLGDFWLSFNRDDEDGTSYSTDTDSMLLRLCECVGEDIRPLFHFWGIHPADPAALDAAVAAAGLAPSPEIHNLLVHYKSLVPPDNEAFRSFALDWWGKQPSINGYWTEREHARQWDETALYSDGDQQRSESTNPGEIYNENSAAEISARVQEIIDIYFTDYTAWAANWPDSDLDDPAADLDGDGLSNDEERIWGLDPTRSSPAHPFTTPFDGTTGSFRYTRRDPALTGLTFSVWTSTDLVHWAEDSGASQFADPPDASDVETVTVTLSPVDPEPPRRFVRLRVGG
jgi:hypothetical protein